MKKLMLVICLLCMSSQGWAQSAPPLGSAQTFAVLGASTVTNTGPTVITGDLGVSPGTIHAADATATAAQAAAHTAYANLVAQPCGANLTGKTLGTSPGAVTLSPGVHCFNTSAQLTGTLTLNGSGVYVFKMGTTLTNCAGNADVILYAVEGGGHTWPGGGALPEWWVGRTTREINATRVMWAFFVQHPRGPN